RAAVLFCSPRPRGLRNRFEIARIFAVQESDRFGREFATFHSGPMELKLASQATIPLPFLTSLGDQKLLRRGNRQCKTRCSSRTATNPEALCYDWHKAPRLVREGRGRTSK